MAHDLDKGTRGDRLQVVVHVDEEVLKDPEKRAAYDQLGSQWRAGRDFRPPPNWDAGFEFSGGGYTGGASEQFSDFLVFKVCSVNPCFNCVWKELSTIWLIQIHVSMGIGREHERG